MRMQMKLMSVAVVVLGALVAGCGSSGGDATTDVALTSTTPTPSGPVDQITWDLPSGEPTTVDPVKAGDYSPNAVVSNACDYLVRPSADFSYGPGLAKWSEPDSTTLVYDIHPGVKFWDGHPLTADDVVYSLNRARDPKTGSINADYFTNVKSIEKTGPLQVTIRFSQPDQLFNKVMASPPGAISEADYVEKAGDSYGTPKGGLMCSGPYELSDWEPGESITMKKNPDYWDPEFEPNVDEVTFKFITESSAITNGLLSGELDGTYEAPVTSVSALEDADNGTLYRGPSTQLLISGGTKPDSPLADPKVVEALNLAIDRNALVENVYGGAAEPARTLIPPAVWSGSPAKDTYQADFDALPDLETPDVDRAKQLVGESSYDGSTIKAAIQAGDEESLRVMTFMQDTAKEIGLKISIEQLQPTEFSSFFYDKSIRESYDMSLAKGYVEVFDPLSYTVLFVFPDSLFNWTGFDVPAAADNTLKALSATSPEASAKYFGKSQKAYTDNALGIWLVVPDSLLFMNSRITGAPASFAYINMPWLAMIGASG